MPGRNAHAPPQAQEGSGGAGCWPGACHAPILPNTTPEPCGRLLSSEPRCGQERLEGSARSPSPTHPKPRSQAGGLVGAVDMAWGSPFSPLGRRVPTAQGSAQNRHAVGAVEGPAALQAPLGALPCPGLSANPSALQKPLRSLGTAARGWWPAPRGAPVSMCPPRLHPVALQPWGWDPASRALLSLALHPILVTPPTSCPAPLCPALLGGPPRPPCCQLPWTLSPALRRTPSRSPRCCALPHPHSLPQATRLSPGCLPVCMSPRPRRARLALVTLTHPLPQSRQSGHSPRSRPLSIGAPQGPARTLCAGLQPF